MSIIRTNQVRDLNNKVLLNPTGQIVQVQYARTDVLTTYSALITGDGTVLNELTIGITPKKAGNILIMQWMITYECGENVGFLIHRDNQLITDVGQEGRNSISNNRWVTYTTAIYDADINSTPSVMNINYSNIANNTNYRTYSPAVRSTTSATSTFYLNRPLLGIGDTLEVGVSVGVIYEVAA